MHKRFPSPGFRSCRFPGGLTCDISPAGVLSCQVVGILEQRVGDLIQVPKPLEHASIVGDHLNFRIINPTNQENAAFQVCPRRAYMNSRTHKVSVLLLWVLGKIKKACLGRVSKKRKTIRGFGNRERRAFSKIQNDTQVGLEVRKDTQTYRRKSLLRRFLWVGKTIGYTTVTQARNRTAIGCYVVHE